MPTLLHYALTTAPFPLQASAQSGNANIATLTIVATNATSNGVTLQGVIVALPVGDGATQLTADTDGIGPVPPANWVLTQTQTTDGTIQYNFQPAGGSGTVGSNEALMFIFNNIEINTQPGTVMVEVIEGMNDCDPQSTCQTAEIAITKFPNGWGEVSFWLNPPIIPAGGTTTLNWSGPAGATYTIEYYTPQTGVVNVPAQGQPALGDEGQYPGQGQPALQLEENTTFYLSVVDDVNGQTYSAQQQITATVELPLPTITSFTGEVYADGATLLLKLTWVTDGQSCELTGTSDTLNPNGTLTITPTAIAPLLSAYTLTATNAAGNTSATLTLEWGAADYKVAISGRGLRAIVLSPDGTRAYTLQDASDDTDFLAALDTTTTPVSVVAQAGKSAAVIPWALAQSTDGTYLLVTDWYYTGSLRVLAPTASDPFQSVSNVVLNFTSMGVAVAPDGASVYVVGARGEIGVLEFTGTASNPLQLAAEQPAALSYGLTGVAVTPDSTRAYVFGEQSQVLAAYDLTVQPIKLLGEPVSLSLSPLGIAVAPDGQRIYVACSGGMLYIYEPTTNPDNPFQPVGDPFQAAGYINGVAVSVDGARVFLTLTTTSQSQPGGVQVLDVTTSPPQQVGQLIGVGLVPAAIAMSPDGTRAYVVNTGADDNSVSPLFVSSVSGSTQ